MDRGPAPYRPREPRDDDRGGQRAALPRFQLWNVKLTILL